MQRAGLLDPDVLPISSIDALRSESSAAVSPPAMGAHRDHGNGPWLCCLASARDPLVARITDNP